MPDPGQGATEPRRISDIGGSGPGPGSAFGVPAPYIPFSQDTAGSLDVPKVSATGPSAKGDSDGRLDVKSSVKVDVKSGIKRDVKSDMKQDVKSGIKRDAQAMDGEGTETGAQSAQSQTQSQAQTWVQIAQNVSRVAPQIERIASELVQSRKAGGRLVLVGRGMQLRLPRPAWDPEQKSDDRWVRSTGSWDLLSLSLQQAHEAASQAAEHAELATTKSEDEQHDRNTARPPAPIRRRDIVLLSCYMDFVQSGGLVWAIRSWQKAGAKVACLEFGPTLEFGDVADWCLHVPLSRRHDDAGLRETTVALMVLDEFSSRLLEAVDTPPPPPKAQRTSDVDTHDPDEVWRRHSLAAALRPSASQPKKHHHKSRPLEAAFGHFQVYRYATAYSPQSRPYSADVAAAVAEIDALSVDVGLPQDDVLRMFAAVVGDRFHRLSDSGSPVPKDGAGGQWALSARLDDVRQHFTVCGGSLKVATLAGAWELGVDAACASLARNGGSFALAFDESARLFWERVLLASGGGPVPFTPRGVSVTGGLALAKKARRGHGRVPFVLTALCGPEETTAVVTSAGGAVYRGKAPGVATELTTGRQVIDNVILAAQRAVAEIPDDAADDATTSSSPKTKTATTTTTKNAFVPLREFDSIWIGVYGLRDAVPSVRDAVYSTLEQSPAIRSAGMLRLTSDVSLLTSPIVTQPDRVQFVVMCIADVGCSSVLYQSDGLAAKYVGRIGGWKASLGIEDGAYKMGVEAIKLAIREIELRRLQTQKPVPEFLERVAAHMGAADLADFGRIVVEFMSAKNREDAERRRRISAVANIVFEHAFGPGTRDSAAVALVQTACDNIVNLFLVPLVRDFPAVPSATVLMMQGCLFDSEPFRHLVLKKFSASGVKLCDTMYVPQSLLVAGKQLLGMF